MTATPIYCTATVASAPVFVELTQAQIMGATDPAELVLCTADPGDGTLACRWAPLADLADIAPEPAPPSILDYFTKE